MLRYVQSMPAANHTCFGSQCEPKRRTGCTATRPIRRRGNAAPTGRGTRVPLQPPPPRRVAARRAGGNSVPVALAPNAPKARSGTRAMARCARHLRPPGGCAARRIPARLCRAGRKLTPKTRFPSSTNKKVPTLTCQHFLSVFSKEALILGRFHARSQWLRAFFT